MAKLNSVNIMFSQDTIDFISSLMSQFGEGAIDLSALQEPVVTVADFDTWKTQDLQINFARYNVAGSFTANQDFTYIWSEAIDSNNMWAADFWAETAGANYAWCNTLESSTLEVMQEAIFNSTIDCPNIPRSNKGNSVRLLDGQLVATYSSQIYKENVHPLDVSGIFSSIVPVSYTGAVGTLDEGKRLYGFIEEDLKEIDETLTVDGGIDTIALLAAAIAEIKTLRLQYDALSDEVTALKEKVNSF